MRRTVTRRTLIQGAAALATAATLPMSRAAAAEKATVALDWYPNANHAGLFIAEADGIFATAGIETDLYTPADPTTVLQTVGAGKDTFGISYQTDVLLARAQGVPVVSIAALVQHPLMAVMSLKTAAIASPKDLVGKKVGYPGIPSQEAYLKTMLEADGASFDDIELVNVGFDLVPAIVSKQVDAVMGAYWTHETIIAEREGYPVDILRVEKWGVPDYYELVLVASEETVEKRSDFVKSFLKAVRAGYASAIADPEKALDTMAAAYPEIDREVETEGLELLIPAWMDGVEIFGEQSAERWDAYGAWMQENGLLPDDVVIVDAWKTI